MKRIMPLRGKKDFSLLFRRGKKIESPLFRLIFLATELPYFRVAIVVAKSVEKRAVLRNRIRRRIREWLRKHMKAKSPSADIIFLVKKESIHTDRSYLYEELEDCLKEI